MRGIFIFIFSFTVCCLQAQIGSPFEKINTNNGLPSNYIFCVAEDANGYLWAGSDKGLLLYNGYGWQVFDTDNGMPGNYINSVISDNKNGLWLSISEMGLFWFDTKTKFTQKVSLPYSHSNMRIIGQNLDKENNLIISGVNEINDSIFLFIADKQNPKKLLFLRSQERRKNLQNEFTHHFLEEKKKSIIYVINNITNKNLSRTNPNYTYFNQKINNSDHYDFNERDFIIANNEYLLGYNFLLRKTDSAYQLITNEKLFETNRQQYNLINRGKKVFVFKFGEGFCIVDSLGKVTKYSKKNGLSSDDVNNIFVAKDGTVYISTLGGGINVLRYNNRITYEFGNAPIRAIQFYNGMFYASTGPNIFALDKNKLQQKYTLQKEALSFFIQNNILYTGNFDGIQKYQLVFDKITEEKRISITAGISAIFPNANKLIASSYGSGIFLINNFTEVKTYFNFPFDNIERFSAISKGCAALSNEKGFYIVDKSLQLANYFTQKDGLLSNAVYCVHEYKDTLWVGTKNGITSIVNDKVINTYNFSKGFSGKNALYIFTDKLGQHWIMSDHYLHVLENDSLKAIGSTSILINNNDEATCGAYNNNDNSLGVGTKSGICIIDLNNITLNEERNNASLYQVKVNNELTEFKTSYDLPFDYKQITFYFANINGLFKRNKILYKLENYNTGWVTLMDSLSITFDQLRPGTYKLFAKTINANSEASENLLLTTIIIKQPIWLSSGMLLFYGLAIAALIYWITISIDKRKFRKKLQALEMQQQLETERQRISRDLHDNMGAYTSALLANVDKLKQNKVANEELNKMKTNAEQILSSLRETIWVLNNKEISVVDFSDAFTTYCFKVLKNFEHINFEVDTDIKNNTILSAPDAIHLNKILQECLQNSIKHSGGSLIKYQIVSEEKIYITISDNGVGYDTTKKHFGNGHENINWRAKEANAFVSFSSLKDEGTIIQMIK